jgi:hypothetical protein
MVLPSHNMLLTTVTPCANSPPLQREAAGPRTPAHQKLRPGVSNTRRLRAFSFSPLAPFLDDPQQHKQQQPIKPFFQTLTFELAKNLFSLRLRRTNSRFKPPAACFAFTGFLRGFTPPASSHQWPTANDWVYSPNTFRVDPVNNLCTTRPPWKPRNS